LILNPKVLLIDEPTSALDKENTLRLVEMLKQLHQEGLTLILITHDLGFAQALCQRVIELKNGEIESDGPASDYFAALS
jgi:ABC-type methionine transport system ATPase subunit